MAFLQAIRNLLVRPAARSITVTGPAPSTVYAVHPLSVTSLDELLKLNVRCFANGENYTKHTFAYLLSQENSLCFQAVAADGCMAGFLCVLVGDDGVAHITTIGVAPEHRRRGLAERLLDRLDRALLERGGASIVLEVRVGNIPAQSLYRACGFSVTQRLSGYYNDGEDGFLMIKAVGA